MHKRLISNQFIEERWTDLQNEMFGKKLDRVKPCKDLQTTGKLMSAFKSKSQNPFPKVNSYEVIKNNVELGNRLSSIYTSNGLRNYIPKTINMSLVYNKRKWENQVIIKDNKSFVQRLIHRSSYYDKKKLDEDFMKKQKYKALICKYPSINSNIPRLNGNNLSNNSQINNSNIYKRVHESNNDHHTEDKFFGSSKIQDGYKKSGSNYLREDDDNLFTGKYIINNFGECLVEFKLSNNQFQILIKRDSRMNYCLVFEKKEEILKLQGIYKSYEEMINQLYFEDGNMYLVCDDYKLTFAVITN